MDVKPLFLIFAIGFTAGCITEPPRDYPLDVITSGKRVKQLGLEFEHKTIQLQQTAHQYQQGKITLAKLKQQLTDTRLALKRVEFILEYYYPEHMKAYINGVPLPHLDPFPYDELPLPAGYYKEKNSINIAPLDYQEPNAFIKQRQLVPAQGLQKLDEILYSADAEQQKDTIYTLTQELAKRTTIMRQALSKRRFIEDYQLVEAARLELVRIFTLGLTGFDTPGSNNALIEANSALTSLHYVLRPLIQHLPSDLATSINTRFDVTAHTITRANFNDLNRLSLLKQNINPLYADLLQAHLQLNPTTSNKLSSEKVSWNPVSDNIFSSEFINPYFYSILTEQQDTHRLRAIGKELFFDKDLSSNHILSCASCHKPELAFTDARKTSLEPSSEIPSPRNAPTLINAIYADRYFYDMRAVSLEDQIAHVIGNIQEFNTSLEEIAKKLNTIDHYRMAFNKTFSLEKQPINKYQITNALTSYIISLRSWNSPFDQFVRGELPELTSDVEDGFNLFMGKAACGSCHFAPTFSGLTPPLYKENDSEVLGVLLAPDVLQLDADSGRSANQLFQENQDIYRRAFKTVSVRNIEFTAPYFHNGAYTTLEQVIDFYDKGGAQGLGLDYEVPNQTLPSKPLNLTAREKSALKAFLLSLSDTSAIQQFTPESGQSTPK